MTSLLCLHFVSASYVQRHMWTELNVYKMLPSVSLCLYRPMNLFLYLESQKRWLRKCISEFPVMEALLLVSALSGITDQHHDWLLIATVEVQICS